MNENTEQSTVQQAVGARICCLCFGQVDKDGESVGECSWVQPAACEECGGCLCDGSC